MYNNTNSDNKVPSQNDSDSAPEADYAHPDYYLASVKQPTQAEMDISPYSYDPYSDNYTGYQSIPPTPDPYAPASTVSPYQEYRGPQSMLQSSEVSYAEGADQSSTPGAEFKQTGKSRKGIAGIGGLLAAIGGFLLKFKSLVFLLKFGTFGITALVSVFVYSFIFGWPFAIGLVLLLFIHEMGHAVVMRLKGIPLGGMIFIPLFGAAVTMRQMPKSAKDEAEVGIAGPIAGALAASVCFFFAHIYPGTIWAPLAYFGFFLNLFNLIPVIPFDGGRVVAAIDRRVWIIGFVALLAYQVWEWFHGNNSPWLLLFVIMAAFQLWSRGRNTLDAQSYEYYNVHWTSRLLISILYFALIAVLFLGMTITHTLIPVAN
ncbi:site-2 protease family protein [Dictyobacter arantiisoli]|uniref:Peptidase M50 domain-containing protein n=1 Tax=Dictyobacter arantiisoli TaxID=2014874 RepID=A0A5A5TFV0_9CHLR|nr:site-2 protease family protein [Dictyobacter arantiisoli]GCF10095.1 hypothetical protein KDI_36590 [Dictyobacter arantiisoli]